MDIASIINGKNGIPVLIILVFVFITALVLIKKGILSFNIGGIHLTSREKELAVIRRQMQYLDTTADTIINTLPDRLKEGVYFYRMKYIVSKFKDLMEETIIYNHIEDNDDFISLKQEMAYNLFIKFTSDEYFKNKEFEEYIYNLVKKLIKKFVLIRKNNQ